jgi:hypothetical protein
MNSSDTKTTLPLLITPTPTYSNVGSIRFSKWRGDATKAECRIGSLEPIPTFSPSLRQLAVCPAESLECESRPAAAIEAAQFRALRIRLRFTSKVGRPRLARSALMSATNEPSMRAASCGQIPFIDVAAGDDRCMLASAGAGTKKIPAARTAVATMIFLFGFLVGAMANRRRAESKPSGASLRARQADWLLLMQMAVEFSLPARGMGLRSAFRARVPNEQHSNAAKVPRETAPDLTANGNGCRSGLRVRVCTRFLRLTSRPDQRFDPSAGRRAMPLICGIDGARLPYNPRGGRIPPHRVQLPPYLLGNAYYSASLDGVARAV